MKVYVYIDYENMGKLQSLPPIDGKYFVFIGAEQKSVPTSLVLAQNENQIEWIQISGNGKNALDFHIAYFLAKHDSEENVLHYILSKDHDSLCPPDEITDLKIEIIYDGKNTRPTAFKIKYKINGKLIKVPAIPNN